MNEQTLRETILNMLDKEPYKSNVEIEDNPLDEINNKIREVIDNPFFESFDKVVSSFYARDIIKLLWDYYTNIYIADNEQNKPFNTQTSKELKKDINTIQKFIDLMRKNSIYIDEIERNYQNKQDDKFVFDYYNNLINDLKTKKFEKSQRYKISKFKATKNNITAFFEQLKKEYPQLRQQDDIKFFIDSI